MYRVRFHGRGGQGIKTAGRILGTAFFHAGFEVQDAPMYGAERRGAPVSASVRADRHLIRERGLITHPDLIVVVDETVIAVATAAVLLGVTPQTVVLMNTAIPSEVWRDQLHLAGLLITMAVSDEVAQQAFIDAADFHVGAKDRDDRSVRARKSAWHQARAEIAVFVL